nr:hypothetical protein [Tanacetum cinerariifolium]
MKTDENIQKTDENVQNRKKVCENRETGAKADESVRKQAKDMKRGFLSQKGSGRGRSVKEKDTNRLNLEVVKDSVDAAIKVVLPSVVDETVAMDYPVVNTQEANAPAGKAPGKPSYATATGKPSRKKVNVHTLYTPDGNRIDVVVSVVSIRVISERFANTAYGFFLGKKVAYHVVANYVRNTWEMASYENLLKEDVSTVPVKVKLYGVPVTAFSMDGLSAIATKLGTPLMLDSYTSDMCMQSWGRSSYAIVMIELRADMELKDNIVVAMPKITREGQYTCAGEKKTVKKPSQTTRGVPIGPKMDFKHQKNIDLLPKRLMLVLVVRKRKVWNLLLSNTPIGEKIDKIKRQIFKRKLRLLDNDGNPLVLTGIMESDDEVDVRDSYPYNANYDPYDDNMYENHDLSKHLQSIGDDLDITLKTRVKCGYGLFFQLEYTHQLGSNQHAKQDEVRVTSDYNQPQLDRAYIGSQHQDTKWLTHRDRSSSKSVHD